MNAKRSAVLLMMLALLQGCGENGKLLNMESFPSSMTFKVEKNGRLSERVLTRGEPLFDLIEAWCRENTSGWSKSYDTFAPTFEFRAEQVSLNVRSDYVVANIKESDDKWIQLIKPTPAEFWQDIRSLAGSELNGE